jgi:hypothetical protein
MSLENKRLTLPGLNKFTVGSKDIEMKSELEKVNPNSLRFVLAFVVAVRFGGDRQAAATALSQHGGKYRSNRTQNAMANINNKALGQILNDETEIKYFQLELFARAIKVPVGAMLLLSRCFSLVRDNHESNAEQFVSAIRALADVLANVVTSKELTDSHLTQMAACFDSALQEEQYSLLDLGVRSEETQKS